MRFTASWRTNGSGSDSSGSWVATDPKYSFAGWTTSPLSQDVVYTVNSSGYINEEFTLPVNRDETQTSILTLYPVFYYHYRLNYNANGGTDAPVNQDTTYHHSEVPDSQHYVISEQRPSRGQYLFVGWSTDRNASIGTYGYPYPNEVGTQEYYIYTKDLIGDIDISKSSGSTTLYAIWWASYYFDYDSRGGINTPSQEHEYNPNADTYHLSTLVPEKDGFTFCGWSTDENATWESEGLLQPGDYYTATPGADGYKLTTFYAVWKANTPEGATNPDATGNGLLGMTMLGRGFASATADTQNDAAEGESQDADAAQNSDGGETDLSSEEKKIDYIFTVDGEEIERQTLADGETIQQPGDPSKEEEGKVFVFVGWFTDGPDGSEVQLFTDKDDDGEIDAEVVTVTEDSQDVTIWAVFEDEKEEQSSESEEGESEQAGQGESDNDKPTEEASEEKSGGETQVGEQGSGQTDPSTGGENTAQEKQEDQTNGVSNQTDQSGNGTDGKSETPKEDPVNPVTDPVTDPVTEPTTPTQDENQGTTEEEAGEPASGGEDKGNGDEEESITQGSADDPVDPEQQNEVNSDPPVDDTPPAEQPEGGTPEGGEGA